MDGPVEYTKPIGVIKVPWPWYRRLLFKLSRGRWGGQYFWVQTGFTVNVDTRGRTSGVLEPIKETLAP